MLGRPHARASLLALLACLTIGLVLPAFASAAEFEVNSSGDGVKAAVGAVCETSTPGECTLRAAIEAANVDPAKDEIVFGPVFNGGGGSFITPTVLLPEILSPARIDGGICLVTGFELPCVVVAGITGFATISVRANDSAVENLRIGGGSVGIRALAQGGPGPGVEIRGNMITGSVNAIESTGTIGGTGNLIEGNTISAAEGYTRGITVQNGPNRIFGNTIEGVGCCYTGIWLSETATGNTIGGDTEASENVIDGFQNGAITLILPESTRNEIGRNRGENGGPFINLGPNSANGGIQPPAIDVLRQSSASGTAEPGAKVRLFRKATEWGGEIESFLDETVADGSGAWSVTFPAIPEGTFVTGTQTLDGGTSGLAEAVGAQADPPVNPPCTVNCGGGGSGGGSQTPPSTQPEPPPADTTKPKLTIKKAPKAKSTSTTAKFVFVSNAAGSKFKCKLDKKAWAGCKSPKTYKQLKPGKHVFKVKATAAGLTSAVVTRKFTVLE